MAPRFLTAEWRNVAMLNYEIDPAILTPRVPAGCELDFREGRTFVSVVGFQFLRTRLLGAPIPFHRNFEEVNLRFYVRRRVEGAWRRGVVFVKELVPRAAVAFVARHCYGENYIAFPMRHAIGTAKPGSTRLSYEWRRQGSWEGLWVDFSGPPEFCADDTEETFITEHYWGYSQRRDGLTMEYQVEHPRWPVWRAASPALHCDVSSLYGAEFVESLSGSPTTAFVAEGSPVVVRQGCHLLSSGSANAT
jgi:uncharacterized protein YqjF (DUF2071 family)